MKIDYTEEMLAAGAEAIDDLLVQLGVPSDDEREDLGEDGLLNGSPEETRATAPDTRRTLARAVLRAALAKLPAPEPVGWIVRTKEGMSVGLYAWKPDPPAYNYDVFELYERPPGAEVDLDDVAVVLGRAGALAMAAGQPVAGRSAYDAYVRLRDLCGGPTGPIMDAAFKAQQEMASTAPITPGTPAAVGIKDGRITHVALCPEHGLHGERTECYVCGGPVEQVPMVRVEGDDYGPDPAADAEEAAIEAQRVARAAADALDAVLMRFAAGEDPTADLIDKAADLVGAVRKASS